VPVSAGSPAASASSTAAAWSPLEGIRVLEISRTTVGAYAGRLFREYGADVVLVEDPADESQTRRYGPFYAPDGETGAGGLHRYLNAGKRGIAVADAHPDGRALIAQLAGSADLVIHELTAPDAKLRGLTHRQLAATRPGVVVLGITPFGEDGPRSHWRATEEILFALSGRMALQGEPQRRPLAYAPVIVSAQIATTACGVAMAALTSAELTGEGGDIDVSGLEAQLCSVDNLFLMWTLGRWEPPRGLYPPYTYPCADSYILLGAVGPRYLAGMARAIGRPELVVDERFSTPVRLAEHQAEFDEIFIPFFLQYGVAELLPKLQDAGVMCAPLHAPAAVLDDAQYAYRGFFQPLDSSSSLRVPGPEFRLDAGAAPPAPAPAPSLGQHTADVLADWLGIDARQADRLRRLGALA
jgi:crotonobetainyl-CoA:carnitine CoA-transferase CaiB-like acyl-CoA transferase